MLENWPKNSFGQKKFQLKKMWVENFVGRKKLYGYDCKVKGASKTGSKLVQVTFSVLLLHMMF